MGSRIERRRDFHRHQERRAARFLHGPVGRTRQRHRRVEHGQLHRVAGAEEMNKAAILVSLVLGAIVGGMAVEYWMTRNVPTPAAQQAAPTGAAAADVTFLKSIAPTQ